MSKELKLITALCEALCFEVITKVDYQERKETKEAAMRYNRGGGITRNRELVCKDIHNALDIDADGMYTSVLINPIISYEVKK